MALRVYILLGRPKVVLIALVICFIITHVLNIGWSIYPLAIGPSLMTEGTLADISFCGENFPSGRAWIFPATSVIVLMFDTVLCVLVVWYALKNLPRALWREPSSIASNLISVMVRDNLMYFLIVFIAMALNTVAEVPALGNSFPYYVLDIVLEVMMTVMVGPWMILSLRRSYEEGSGAYTSGSNEFTTVAFVNPCPRQESVAELA